MTAPRLLLLHLRSPLPYREAPLPFPPAAGPEGSDQLFVFPEDHFPPPGAPGPAAAPAPRPRFSGEAQPAGAGTGGADHPVPAGDYWFAQWEAEDEVKLMEGAAAFARELAEGTPPRKTKGPWLLRILVEDGRTRCQGLREKGD